jgi:hypothetical protein
MSQLITAQEATRNSETSSITAATLLSNVNAAILAASLSGQFVLSYDTTGQTVSDVASVSSSFTQQGFITTINPTTLVINWPL